MPDSLPTPPTQPNTIQGDGQDATRDFAHVINDPRRWIVKLGVPLFKSHQRTDPATGKLISVDLPKLYRIAKNMQTMERQNGVPIRMTLGHTEPGKPETEQPPVGGYYRNARVQPFGPKGEPAIVADELLDPTYAQNRKNYPYRSAEYYDDTEQITGVALLTRDPFLDLGVVAYSADKPFVAYTKTAPNAVHYSRDGIPHYAYRLVMADNPAFYADEAQDFGPHGGKLNRGFVNHQERFGIFPAGPFHTNQRAPRSGHYPTGSVRIPDTRNTPSEQQTGQYPHRPTMEARYAAPLPEEGGRIGRGRPASAFPSSEAAARLARLKQQYLDMHNQPAHEGDFIQRRLNQSGLTQPNQSDDDLPLAEEYGRYAQYAEWFPEQPDYEEHPDDEYSPEDRARMNAPHAQANRDRQRRQDQMEQDRQELEGRRNRRELPPGQYANFPGEPMPPQQRYSAPWGGMPASSMNYKPPGYAPHHHTSTGAVYANQPRTLASGRGRGARYADDMGMDAAAMSSDPLQTVYTCLSQAVEALQGLLGQSAGGPGSPPPGPFPEEQGMGGGMDGGMGMSQPGGPPMDMSGGGMGPASPMSGPGGPSGMSATSPVSPTRASRYADRPMHRPSMSPRSSEEAMRPKYARYDRAGTPQPQNPQQPAPATTISGLPVGYQMRLEQIQYENRQLKEAMNLLYYERDMADTETCVAQIQRLASMGFQVGDYEVQELKAKPREQREQYIQHIMTKYQRIGTEMPPLMMGDPTPAPPADVNRPLSRDEMDQALKLTANSNDPGAFTRAVQYLRSGGNNPNPTMYGPAFTGNPGYGFNPNQGNGEWLQGDPAQEPNLNGHGNPFAGE